MIHGREQKLTTKYLKNVLATNIIQTVSRDRAKIFTFNHLFQETSLNC
jgi:hypothetical protein